MGEEVASVSLVDTPREGERKGSGRYERGWVEVC